LTFSGREKVLALGAKRTQVKLTPDVRSGPYFLSMMWASSIGEGGGVACIAKKRKGSRKFMFRKEKKRKR